MVWSLAIGGDSKEREYEIELGASVGTVDFYSNSLLAPDHFSVSYEDREIYSSLGEVKGQKTTAVYFGPGTSTKLQVKVSSQSALKLWSFKTSCPRVVSSSLSDCLYIPSHLYGAPKEEWQKYECREGKVQLKQGLRVASAGQAEDLQVEKVQAPSVQNFTSSVQTGDAVVGYPLELPPAPAGFVPSLSLAYSSGSVEEMKVGIKNYDWNPNDNADSDPNKQKNDGFKEEPVSQSSNIGIGWNLSGIPQIVKNFNGSYYLSLAGQSYELFMDESDRTVYRTRPESFLKVVRKGPESDPNGDKDIRPWDIWTKDGTYYRFEKQGFTVERNHECDPSDDNGCVNNCNGNTNIKFKNLRNYQRWAITQTKDLSGNQIVYEYDLNETKAVNGDCSGCGNCDNFSGATNPSYPRAIYPKAIKYGKGQQSKVEFVYEDRADKAIRNLDDQKIVNFYGDKKLSRIEVYLDDSHLLRTYLLDQIYSNDQYAGRRLMLGSIDLQGVGVTFPASQTFSYFCPPVSSYNGPGYIPPANCSNNADDFNHYAFLLKKADNGYGGSVEYVYGQETLNPNIEVDGFSYRGLDGLSPIRNQVKEKITSSSVSDQKQKIAYDYSFDKSLNSYCVHDSDPSNQDCFNQHSVIANEFWADFEFLGYHYVKETISSSENGGNNWNPYLSTYYVFNQGDQHCKNGDCHTNGVVFVPSLKKGTLAKKAVFDANDQLLSVETNNYEVTDDNNSSLLKNFLYLAESKSCADLNLGDPNLRNDLRHGGYSKTELTDFDRYGNVITGRQYEAPVSCSATGNSFDYVVDLPAPIISATTKIGYNYIDEDNQYRVGNPVSTALYDLTDGNKIKSLSLFSYDNNGRLIETVKAETDGNTVRERAPNNNIKAIMSKVGYDSFGNPVRQQSYEGYVLVNLREDTDTGKWNYVITTEPSGQRTSITAYDETYQAFPKTVRSEPAPFNNTVTTKYDFEISSDRVLGLPVEVIDPNGLATQTSYDPFGRVEKVAGPGDSLADPTVKYTYFDNQKESVNAPFSVKVEKKDENGYLSSFVFYDDLGKKLQTQSVAPKVNYSNHLFIDLTEYDALGRATKSYASQDIHEDTSTDCKRVLGRYTACVDRNFVSETTYDLQGRVVRVKSPNGSCSLTKYEGKKTYSFDPEANLSLAYDTVFENNQRIQRSTVYEKKDNNLSLNCSGSVTYPPVTDQGKYRPYSSSKTETNILGQTVKSSILKGNYDSAEALSQSTSSFDGFGRVVHTFDPDLGDGYITNYNALSQALVTKDRNNVFRSSVYDSLGRITEVYEEDCYQGTISCTPRAGNIPKAQLEYDKYDSDSFGKAKGKLVKETSYNALEKQYFYQNPKGLLSQTTIKLLSPQDSFLNNIQQITEDFTYDSVNRMKTSILRTNPEVSVLSETLTNNYDAIGRLSSVTSNNSQSPFSLSNIVYNRFGATVERTFGNGTKEKLTFDEQGKTLRLTSQEVFKTSNPSDKLLSFSYPAYDKVGNLLKIIDNLSVEKDKTTAYTYDGMYRLIKSAGTRPSSYAYDELGRMTYKSEGDASGTLYLKYANFNVNNFLASYPLDAPKEVRGGRDRADSSSTIDYTKGNLAKSYYLSQKQDNPNPIIPIFKMDYQANYQYDNDSRLTTIKNKDNSQTVSDFLYDYQGQRVKKTNYKEGTTSTSYYLAGVEITKDTTTPSSTMTTIKRYYPGNALRVLKFDNSNNQIENENKLYYLYSDYLSSTRVIADSQGNKIPAMLEKTLYYYPYGSQQPFNYHSQDYSSLPTDHLYTGQVNDGSLYYYNARYYDPFLGIFTSADRAQGPNRYAYAGGNPIMRNDPSGNTYDSEAGGGPSPSGTRYPNYNPNVTEQQWRERMLLQRQLERERTSEEMYNQVYNYGQEHYSWAYRENWDPRVRTALDTAVIVVGVGVMYQYSGIPEWAAGQVSLASKPSTVLNPVLQTLLADERGEISLGSPAKASPEQVTPKGVFDAFQQLRGIAGRADTKLGPGGIDQPFDYGKLAEIVRTSGPPANTPMYPRYIERMQPLLTLLESEKGQRVVSEFYRLSQVSGDSTLTWKQVLNQLVNYQPWQFSPTLTPKIEELITGVMKNAGY